MALALFDSKQSILRPFAPENPEAVTLYVCGPTVYNRIHIGNGRAAVVFDLLFRTLRRHYPVVRYARNFTDVDDKINAAAAAEGISIGELTERYAVAYDEDVEALGALEPTMKPRATEHVGEMIAMIENLIASGHAYAAEGHVLFAVTTDDAYGTLARRALEDMIAGARVEVAPYKRHPADFVLWKPSSPELPGWDSPWGRGRPGWHIECSAMIERHLGPRIDIHGGGADLKFPHHENEAAQSRCAHGGQELTNFWLHNGMVNFGGEKMSKSLGNIVTVAELRERYAGETLRYALLSAHYRSTLAWSEQLLESATAAVDRLYTALRTVDDPALETPLREPSDVAAVDPAVAAALDDDLATPAALAELHRLAGAVHKAKAGEGKRAAAHVLRQSALALGLLQLPVAAWFTQGSEDGLNDAAIDALIAERQAARAAKDFATADKLRDELLSAGIELEDTPTGPRWRRAR